jgi:hypothetical protein
MIDKVPPLNQPLKVSTKKVILILFITLFMVFISLTMLFSFSKYDGTCSVLSFGWDGFPHPDYSCSFLEFWWHQLPLAVLMLFLTGFTISPYIIAALAAIIVYIIVKKRLKPINKP